MGRVSSWIRDWLKGRQQHLVLNSSYSEWVDVVSRVRQGSVLGPILFIMYINDIDKYIVSEVLKFVYDTKVLSSVSTPEDINKLRSDLVLLGKWSSDCLKLFNVDKCKVIHLGKITPWLAIPCVGRLWIV